MKLAIHNGLAWNRRWIDYCSEKGIPFLLVDCYSSDIIKDLKDNEVTHLMWHFIHSFPEDIFLARNVLFAVQKIGVKVFPDFDTAWHFDDKVSQKYLLESVDAPLVPSFVFTDKQEALNWLRDYKYPIVAKLRRGACSYNVKLLKSFSQARKYTNTMFGRGLKPTPGYLADGKNKLKVAKDWKGILKRLKKAPGFFKVVKKGGLFPREKGYVYFQEFIPNNKEDLRVAIVGDHIWAFKRKTRDNDFRASGSGMVDYNLSDVPISVIKEMHKLSKDLSLQSVGFDLIKGEDGEYLIVEISYGYVGLLLYNAPGYWDGEYNFVEKHVYPEHVILENFIK